MRKFFGVFALLVFLSMAGLATDDPYDWAPALAGDVGSVSFVAAIPVSESEGILESAQAICVTPEVATAQIFARFPRAVIAAEVSAPVIVEAIVASYNARPPPTDITADLVMVYEKPPIRTYRVVLFNDGCQVGRIDWPIHLFQRLLSGVGQPV